MASLLTNYKVAGANSSAAQVAALIAVLTPEQRAFVEDPHRFKLARAARRSGKTLMIALYCIIKCIEAPNVPVLYAGLTRDSAKKAIWDILIQYLHQFNIEHVARPSALSIEFPNGSSITLFGCDAENARNRLRGRKFKLACFDETGFFAALDPLVYAVLPTLADFRGTLCLTSSPGEVLSGLFYEADCGSEAINWSRYSWTLYENPLFAAPSDNPEYATRADEELATICRLQFGGNRDHPAFRREYMGEWVADATSLVYPLSDTNLVASPYKMVGAEHAMGLNLASNVMASFVIGRYSEQSRDFQFVESGIYEELDLDDLASRISAHIETYKPTVIMAALSDRTDDVVKELRRRYRLPIQPTYLDTNKAFHQRVFSTDLKAGYIKVVRGLPLETEFAKIVKDKTGEEIVGQQNWAADAALAVYRQVYQFHLQTFVAPLTEEERHLSQLEQSQHEVAAEWWER